MATQAFVLGIDGKLYYGIGGAALTAMTEIANVKDVTITLEKGEANVTTRANAGWEATAGTLKKCTVEFEMNWTPGDAAFEAIKTAYLNNTLVSLAPLTGAKTEADSEGPHADFSITSFTRKEPLEEAITVSVTAKLSVYRDWVKTTGT
jgi:hypothetical protein